MRRKRGKAKKDQSVIAPGDQRGTGPHRKAGQAMT